MIGRPEHDLTTLLQDDVRLDDAVARAQADAIRRHRLLGDPVVTWRDGRVVIEPDDSPDTTPEDDAR